MCAHQQENGQTNQYIHTTEHYSAKWITLVVHSASQKLFIMLSETNQCPKNAYCMYLYEVPDQTKLTFCDRNQNSAAFQVEGTNQEKGHRELPDERNVLYTEMGVDHFSARIC